MFDWLKKKSSGGPSAELEFPDDPAHADAVFQSINATIQRTLSDLLRNDPEVDTLYGALKTEPARVYLSNYVNKRCNLAHISQNMMGAITLGSFTTVFGDSGSQLMFDTFTNVLELNNRLKRDDAPAIVTQLFFEAAMEAEQHFANPEGTHMTRLCNYVNAVRSAAKQILR